MIGTSTRKVLFAAAGCLLLAGCGPAKTTGAAAGAHPASTSTPATPAATAAAPGGSDGGGGGLTACQVITPQDASTAIGKTVGPGTAGGTAALSECIYGDGSLIVGVKADGKALYDKSHNDAVAKGAKDLSGVGDGAFVAGTTEYSTLLLLKGTTLVSILFSGTDAETTSVALAKVAASKL